MGGVVNGDADFLEAIGRLMHAFQVESPFRAGHAARGSPVHLVCFVQFALRELAVFAVLENVLDAWSIEGHQ